MFRFLSKITRVIHNYVPFATWLATTIVEVAKRLDEAKQPKSKTQ